jgi:hypothetical protein
MSTSYERLRLEIEVHARKEVVSEPVAAMTVMLLEVLGMARYFPQSLRSPLVLACQRWLLLSSPAPLLEPARVAAWSFLQEKNGSSTMVKDRVDIAVRLLICILWDAEHAEDDFDMTLGYFADLSDQFARLS